MKYLVGFSDHFDERIPHSKVTEMVKTPNPAHKKSDQA